LLGCRLDRDERRRVTDAGDRCSSAIHQWRPLDPAEGLVRLAEPATVTASEDDPAAFAVDTVAATHAQSPVLAAVRRL
jgi:hypothetical protein